MKLKQYLPVVFFQTQPQKLALHFLFCYIRKNYAILSCSISAENHGCIML